MSCWTRSWTSGTRRGRRRKTQAPVYNCTVSSTRKMRVPSLSTKTVSSSAVHKPIGSRKTGTIGGGSARNEIFVDILERLTMLFAANGSVVNSAIDGCIQMKSYLAGNPELRLALNEDLVVGQGRAVRDCGARRLQLPRVREIGRLRGPATPELRAAGR